MNIVQNIDTRLSSILNDYVRKPTLVRGVVHLMLILYAARLAPTPPKIVLQLFDNVYFKLFIFSLILWTAQFSPSTSILIALAFMITVNYTTTGKLWEMMDNVGPTSVSTAMDAIKVLSEAAISPTASSPTIIAPIAKIAVSASTTQEGIMAIKALAEQAVTPEAGTAEKVQNAANTAIDSITTVLPTVLPTVKSESIVTAEPVVTAEQAVQAVRTLAEAAVSKIPVPVENVQPVAQIALSAITTKEGGDAVKALAQQAVTAESGMQSKVNSAVETAIASIKVDTSSTTEQQSGCYPIRNYDMTKVSGLDGKSSFEDYQSFTSTPE